MRRFEELSAAREPVAEQDGHIPLGSRDVLVALGELSQPVRTSSSAPLDNGVSGALEGPSAYLMKSPPKQLTDDEAHDAVERFIKQYGRKAAKPKAAQRA